VPPRAGSSHGLPEQGFAEHCERPPPAPAGSTQQPEQLVTPPHEQIWLAPFGAQSGFVNWLQLLVAHELLQVCVPFEQFGTQTSPAAHGVPAHGSMQLLPPRQQVLVQAVPPQVHAGSGNGLSG